MNNRQHSKPMKKPLHEAREDFSYCTREERENCKNCGDCPLNPRPANIFASSSFLRMLLQSGLSFLIGALCATLLLGR